MRALWAAVVLQARDDLDHLNYDTTLYLQALSFFTAAGEWRASRQAIADFLDVGVEVIERLGIATIAARTVRDGGRPVPVLTLPGPASLPAFRSADADHTEMRSAAPVSKPPPVITLLKKQQPRAVRDKRYWIDAFLAKRVAQT